MANEVHLSMLQGGISVWHEFRNQNPHEKKDLSGADLTGMDLSRFVLDGVDLRMAKLNRAKLLNALLQRADLEQANLSQADLTGANLTEAKLQEAIMEEAVLTRAKLERADLSGAMLKRACLDSASLKQAKLLNADLQAANLAGTNLNNAALERSDMRTVNATGANFGTARLTNASLSGADLQDADLGMAHGLLQSQLAGANLYRARLALDMQHFGELDRVAEISKHARRVFFTLVLVCVLSWVAILQATDEALVTNAALAPLPLIQATVPITTVFYLVPLFLFVLFIYFQVHLQDLWTGLASLPAIFPKGETLDRQAFPWIATSMVYIWVPRLKDRRPTYWQWQVLISVVGAWLLVPFTMLWFWFRYLRLGNVQGTFWLICLLFLVLWWSIAFFGEARRTFGQAGLGSGEPVSTRVKRWILPTLPALTLSALCFALYCHLPYFAACKEGQTFCRTVVSAFGSSWTSLDLRYAELSKRPPKYDFQQAIVEDVGRPWIDLVRGADLEERRLTNALLWGAFLVNANLRAADLRGADLRNANLSGADLRETMLDKANFEGATLRGTNLRGVNLAETKGLAASQVAEACCDTKTKLPPSLVAAGVTIKPCGDGR